MPDSLVPVWTACCLQCVHTCSFVQLSDHSIIWSLKVPSGSCGAVVADKAVLAGEGLAGAFQHGGSRAKSSGASLEAGAEVGK